MRQRTYQRYTAELKEQALRLLALSKHSDGYSFEFPVKVPGGTSTNFIDLYRRAHFVFGSKQSAAQKIAQSALELATHRHHAGAHLKMRPKLTPERCYLPFGSI